MVIEYKCPDCGSNMLFDSTLQQMVCEHCGNAKTVEQLNKMRQKQQEEVEYRQEEHADDFGARKETFIHYKCPSCGAEILTDEHTAATFCSFCQSPKLMEDRLTGEKTPAQIIPFKINREQAQDMYRKWCRKGLLTPKDFMQASTIEKISGIYVPFWLYDYRAKAQITANCTRVHRERRGDYEYIHTEHYAVSRDVSSEYQKIPADASEKMADDVMDKLEPFQYQDMEKFEMPYLSGYLAEKYNYTSEQLAKRVESRVYDYIMQQARGTISGYTTTAVTGQQVRLRRTSAKYTMLPVWMLNYRYKGKMYQFALNGQTGKIVANRPVSIGKAICWFAGITAVSFTIMTIAGGMLP